MRLLRALDVKVLRDAERMGGQLLAIALVIACGLGVFLGMRSTMRSLATARDVYYAEQRFAHVFARLERAPETLTRRFAALPGVQRVATRVVADVTLDLPDMVEPARGRLVSLPDAGAPPLNGLALRAGRLPRARSRDEVVVNEAFAQAQRLALGEHLAAIIDGKREELVVVGVALSPEYTYALAPGQLFPDDRRFGVLWMRRAALAPAFDLDGAFNDVSLLLERGAHPDGVIERVDELLEPYGGVGAVARADQQSAFFIENELRQLDTFAWTVPLLFLGVAAFLFNVVIGRIVAGQRAVVAALKAFGYRDAEIGLHYAKLVGAVTLTGVAGGLALGAWIGASMVRLYGHYYRFPDLAYRLGAQEVLIGLGVCALAAGVGAWAAVRRTVALPPAEALRPEAPATYRRTLLERVGATRLVPPWTRIVLRELERQPHRAALTMVGIAFATALTVANSFTLDSVRYLLSVQFGLEQREDVQVTLARPRATVALASLRALPGVRYVEPSRTIPARLVAGSREHTTAVTCVPADARLTRLLDVDLRPVPLSPDGLTLSRKLAERLGVRPGERVTLEVLEGERRHLELPVLAVAETYVGMFAYLDLAGAPALLGEAPSLDGARLSVDRDRLQELYAAVKEVPMVAGIATRDTVLRKVREQLDQNLGVFVLLSLSFSMVLAMGVLFNSARITLAERARELASLRVLGFRRAEVAAILLGELGLLTAVAMPLGLWLGHALAALLVRSPGYDTDQFRLPLVIDDATYATAALCVVAAALISGAYAWRKLDRFDMVEVLKTRD